MPDFAGRDAELCGAVRTGQPYRQCADPRPRAGPGQPRAAALGQQSHDGCGLPCRAQGRRRRGRDHAAVARQGAWLSDRQGEDRAGALRHPSCRRDGEGEAGLARPEADRVLGRRPQRRPRGPDAAAGLRALQRLRHGGRRRLPDRLHVGDDRRAQGHHAFPSRHARGLRFLRQTRAARGAVGPLHRLAAARLHVRARRPCAVSDADRRVDCFARTHHAGRYAGRDPAAPRHRLFHGADRVPRDDRQAR